MRASWKWPALILVGTGLVSAGCGDDDGVSPGTDAGVGVDSGGDVDSGGGTDGGGGLPADPPTTVSMVANEGFTSPSDAVVSNDGSTIFFAAFTETDNAAIFSVPSTGGTAVIVFEGLPLEYVSGLVLSLDGATLYIAESAGGPDGEGGIYSMPTSGAMPSEVMATGLSFPNALALDMEGAMLIVSGQTSMGVPAVFRVPLGGGTAMPVASGGELVSPTGVYVDPSTNDIWLLDHLAVGANGQGVLWKIHGTDLPVEVVSGMRLGTPAGVSLTAGGGTAVIASRNATDTQGSLITVNLATMAVGTAADTTAMTMQDPAGLRVSRGSGVFGIADSEGNAIFSAR